MRRLGLVLSVLLAAALGTPAVAQGPAPLTARLILKDPPPNVLYSPTQPIPIVIEVRNPSGVPVITAEGFSRSEFWRNLFFISPQGGTIANVAQPKVELDRTFFCLSRKGVLLRPTAVQVVPLEMLEATVEGTPPATPTGFFVGYTIDDVRKYYDLSRPGRYIVDARIPLTTFRGDMATLIDDCDQLQDQTVARVDAVKNSGAFTVLSNRLEFTIGSPLRFGGFRKPLIGDAQCQNAAKSPCTTVKVNRTFWVEFQLFGADNAPITTAHPRIVVSKVGGGSAMLEDDLFEFHAGQKEYRYLLQTRRLTPGVWRIDVIVDIDGSVHSAHIGLR